MLIKVQKNIGIAVLIIGVLYFGKVMNNSPITFGSLSNHEELSQLDLSMDTTAYSEERGYKLNADIRNEILSEIITMNYYRSKLPNDYHGNRTISFNVKNNAHNFRMYYYLDICKPEWSVIEFNGKGYRISKDDAIKLFIILDENLPLDSSDIRCKY